MLILGKAIQAARERLYIILSYLNGIVVNYGVIW